MVARPMERKGTALRETFKNRPVPFISVSRWVSHNRGKARPLVGALAPWRSDNTNFGGIQGYSVAVRLEKLHVRGLRVRLAVCIRVYYENWRCLI